MLKFGKRALLPDAPPGHIGVACQCSIGLRGSEMAREEPWHVGNETTNFIIPPSKHDPEWRSVPIPAAEVPLFDKLRACLPFPRRTYPAMFRRVCHAYQSEATPHDARRFFATCNRCLDVPLTTIQFYLRHKSTQTTEIYIRTMAATWHSFMQKHFHPVPSIS